MKVLHLIDASRGETGPCTWRHAAETIARLADDTHHVTVAASALDYSTAARVGLPIHARIDRPGRLHPSWWRRGNPLGLGCEVMPDLVHAWSLDAAVWARRILPRLPTVATISFDSMATRRLPDDVRFCRTSASLLGEADAALIAPAIDSTWVDLMSRSMLRASWNADETTMVVGLLGEPIIRADAWMAASIVSRAAMTGKDIRLVIHPLSNGRIGLRRWFRELGLEEGILIDDRLAEPWRVLSGLDVALSVGAPSHRNTPPNVLRGVGPLYWAMVAGVSVVAERNPLTEELLADGRGIVTRPGDLNEPAAALLDLFDTPGARRQADRARVWALPHTDPDRVAASIRALYEGRSPEPEQPRGGVVVDRLEQVGGERLA